MPVIKLRTEIKADIELVFDLTRSIDLHKISVAHTKERAVGGKTSGLLGLGDTVTWRAKHFGIYQKLTSRVTGFERPTYFADEMVKGAFKQFKHEHFFSAINEGTLVIDVFNYKSPLGVLGNLADRLFLEKYMTKFLSLRNESLKHYAETGLWKKVLAKEFHDKHK